MVLNDPNTGTIFSDEFVQQSGTGTDNTGAPIVNPSSVGNQLWTSLFSFLDYATLAKSQVTDFQRFWVDRYDPAPVFNTNFWLYNTPFDLTGVVVNENNKAFNGPGGCLIGRDFSVHAWHGAITPTVGNPVTFVDRFGVRHDRTVTHRAGNASTDVGIALYDAPLPDHIPHYAMFEHPRALLGRSWFPGLVFDDGGRCGMHAVRAGDPIENNGQTGHTSWEDEPYASYWNSVVSGDSGDCIFIPVRDQLVWGGCHLTSGGSGGSTPTQVQPVLDDIMTQSGRNDLELTIFRTAQSNISEGFQQSWTMQGKTLQNAQDASGAAITFNLNGEQVQQFNLTGDVTTLAVSGQPINAEAEHVFEFDITRNGFDLLGVPAAWETASKTFTQPTTDRFRVVCTWRPGDVISFEGAREMV